LLSGGRLAGIRINPDCRCLLGMEAKIHIEHAQKTPNQQPRAHQQHAGKGDFRNHQCAAHPVAVPACRGATGGILQSVMHGIAGHLESGSESKNDACYDRSHQAVREDRDVRSHTAEQRNAERLQARENARPHGGKQDTEYRAAA
jgi:hypothetical protein